MAIVSSNNTKKIITAVCGVLLVALVVVLVIVFAQKDGFVIEDGEVYYYEKGEMQYGWKIINDDRYYFDADGTMHRGWLEIDENTKYYFRKGNLDKGGNDMGGTLMINGKANITVDGELRYFEFDEYGKVIVDVPVK